jgi:hypothetical protein
VAQEKKLLFGFSDIRAVRFTCGHAGCGAVQSFPVKAWTHTPRTCSNDPTHDWLKDGSPEQKMFTELREALQGLIKYNGTSAFKVQLEFDAEDAD